MYFTSVTPLAADSVVGQGAGGCMLCWWHTRGGVINAGFMQLTAYDNILPISMQLATNDRITGGDPQTACDHMFCIACEGAAPV